MDFVIENGNIVYCDTDAIVLPANPMLREGSGTSRAIFTAAGRNNLKKACEQYKVPVEVGMAYPTSGYDLEAKYIIHAVVPKWIDGNKNEFELLATAYISSLTLADKMKCKSIAFPLLSAGNNGFDRELAFRIATESIKTFQPTNLETIKLIVYDVEMAVFIQSQGYDVINRFTKEKKKLITKKTVETIGHDVLEFFADEENRENARKIGAAVFSAVVAIVSKGQSKQSR